MTYNEFKICFYIFKKCFKKKTIGEILPNCLYEINENDLVKEVQIHRYKESYKVCIFGVPLFVYRDYDPDNLVILTRLSRNSKIKTVEDFLNYFKIHLEDII